MTKEEMLAIIKTTFPDLPIDKIQVNDSGWDHDIFILNNELVFRFPKSSEFLSKIKDEGKILQLLMEIKPALQVPQYEYVYQDGLLKGVRYPYLEGIPLSKLPLNDIESNRENAKSIGDFLSKLHSIDVERLDDTNLTTIHTMEYWKSLHSNVQKDVFPYLTNQQQKEIDEVFLRFTETKSTYKRTLIHGDLTSSNIIYNKASGCISGIIDFTDAQIGDPAFDFAGLYWDFGRDFTVEVLSWYSGSENPVTLFNRVKNFYGLQPVFHELLYSIKCGKEINWETALDRFSYLYQYSES
ncbi:aminoglycoside phosphotransferase family protein [Bacillus massilinigeriensis]|uniref:aminoglycoside phosphotransferase family protein n=1 Tax=Bacillus mediterraneensis TaxID=1805474 RepID=UPI0008F826D8|nr:aminoglycoside phosphotransferase family protein [Bacillus mediterraneensis]